MSQSMRRMLIALYVCCVIIINVTVYGAMPYATFWSTFSCDKWVSFDLIDYNSQSSKYMQSYGLDSLDKADITIVGMYFADDETCQSVVQLQEQLGDELTEAGIKVSNVALNYYAPESCALETGCDMYWSYYSYFWWYVGYYESNPCYNYIAGCAPTDSRLVEANWQALLAAKTTLPIFQDTDWEDAWENFGGGQGDLFVYDSIGRLYSYICTQSHCDGYSGTVAVSGGLTSSAGYETIKKYAILASGSNGTERCSYYDDDYSDFYYWYYRDDDMYYRDLDDDYDDDYDDKVIYTDNGASVYRNYHKSYHTHEKFSLKVPWWGYALVVLFAVCLLLFGYRYYKVTRGRGQNVYSRVLLNDPDHVNDSQNSFEQGDFGLPFTAYRSGGGDNRGRNVGDREGLYGSL